MQLGFFQTGKSSHNFSSATMQLLGLLPLAGSDISFAINGPLIAQHPRRCAPVLLPEQESKFLLKTGHDILFPGATQQNLKHPWRCASVQD